MNYINLDNPGFVKNLEDHPFLWELLKKHITYKEGKDSNYPKEQLEILINYYIQQREYSNILSVLLSEVIINTPMVNGYKIYDLENLELSNSPMLIGLIKINITNRKDDVHVSSSVRNFMNMVSWTFKHELGEEIVGIALNEAIKNDNTPQLNTVYKDVVALPEASKKVIGNYIKKLNRQNMIGMPKFYFNDLIISEYKRLRNEGKLHEVFEMEELTESKISDEDWQEYIELTKESKTPPKSNLA
ncbi:hypothetical protein DHD05_08090 [Arenibacter sp. N53]|uniref:hypothetical protein n=1 Tax=Arenibacter TaxID=178469 RepID=UPI000CD451CA|nr:MULTISPECIES: hypothetical protein [Arenibacter]MCM4151546.1 hypothetical protein [Arenibacter sp. N53]